MRQSFLLTAGSEILAATDQIIHGTAVCTVVHQEQTGFLIPTISSQMQHRLTWKYTVLYIQKHTVSLDMFYGLRYKTGSKKIITKEWR